MKYGLYFKEEKGIQWPKLDRIDFMNGAHTKRRNRSLKLAKIKIGQGIASEGEKPIITVGRLRSLVEDGWRLKIGGLLYGSRTIAYVKDD